MPKRSHASRSPAPGSAVLEAVDRGPCRCKKEQSSTKDVGTLERLCSQQGKLFSRKRSGNCAKHQRQLKNAVKQARYVGLLPFVG
jgi:small subunit ribosomal protein S18